MSAVRTGGPWAINEREFPRDASIADQLRFLLQYAVLAPSTRNSQPWKFAVADDRVDILVDTGRWLRVSDADQRELYISAGCALENLVLAARYFRLAATIDHLPDPSKADLAARVRFAPGAGEPGPETTDLFLAIRRRFTNHGVFDGIGVAERHLESLRRSAAEPGLELVFATDAPTLHTLDELVMRADALLLSDHDYRHELGASVGSGALGTSWLLGLAGRFAVSYLSPTQSFVDSDHAKLVSSPAFGLITAAENSRAAQVRTGQALERIYLLADGLGMCVTPMSQLMQAAEVRPELGSLLARDRVPLQPFRLGYAKPPKAFTSRRAVDEMMV